MNRTNNTSPRHQPLLGGAWMIFSGVVFAIINSGLRYASFNYGLTSTSLAFYQYFIAFIVIIPFILRRGGIRKTFRTKYWKLHFFRVLFAVIGVQFWTAALTQHIHLGQGIALLMLAPLFTTLGSALFLKEKIGVVRIIATLVGFIGAVIILEPWDSDFSYISLLPVAAAFFWSGYSILMKKQTHEESSYTIVAYLFALMIPLNLFILFIFNYVFSSQILGDLSTLKYLTSNIYAWILVFILGILTAITQYALTKAYTNADASYLQPFDHAKLLFNLLLGWLIFAESPEYKFWIGAFIIVASVSWVTQREHKKQLHS